LLSLLPPTRPWIGSLSNVSKQEGEGLGSKDLEFPDSTRCCDPFEREVLSFSKTCEKLVAARCLGNV